MIICVCHNLNSRQLNECLARGLSLEDISQEMGLGTGCGACLEYAGELLAEGQRFPTPQAGAPQFA